MPQSGLYVKWKISPEWWITDQFITASNFKGIGENIYVTEYTIIHKFIKRKKDKMVCVYQETGQADKTE